MYRGDKKRHMHEQGVGGREEALREGGAIGFCYYGNRTALSVSRSLGGKHHPASPIPSRLARIPQKFFMKAPSLFDTPSIQISSEKGDKNWRKYLKKFALH